jgi:hypothetical protein
MNTTITTIAEINGESIEYSFETQSCLIDKTSKRISIKSKSTDELHKYLGNMAGRAYHTNTPIQTSISIGCSTDIISGCWITHIDYGDCGDGSGVLAIEIAYR